VRDFSLDSVLVRSEVDADIPAIYELHRLAFDSDEEAKLVDKLREAGESKLSLVAEYDGICIGHIFYSTVSTAGSDSILGLAPMAVTPDLQGCGVGTLLVSTSLDRLQKESCPAVVVLGHPDYYPRFGFKSASTFGLKCTFDVPDGVFMAMELTNGGLGDVHGLVEYHPLFNAF